MQTILLSNGGLWICFRAEWDGIAFDNLKLYFLLINLLNCNAVHETENLITLK